MVVGLGDRSVGAHLTFSLLPYMLEMPCSKIVNVAYLVDVKWDLLFFNVIFLIIVSSSIFSYWQLSFLIYELLICPMPVFLLVCLYHLPTLELYVFWILNFSHGLTSLWIANLFPQSVVGFF